jgi:outer membrane protein assembly factor BamB
MPICFRIAFLGALILLAPGFSELAHAEDWPQWLGPDRDGLTQETGLLPTWPDGGPPLAWRIDTVGLGYSGPAVVGGRLYIMGTRDDAELLFCLDAATGDEIWSAELGEVYENDWGDGPRGTPTVDNDRVYCLAAKGALVCFDASSGDEIWRVTMQSLGGKIPTWGYAESPLIDDDKILVTPGGSEGAVAMLDKMDGRLLWQANEVEDGAHYSSIMVAMPHGKKQYVQLLEKRLIGLDAENGALLWEVAWPGRVAVIPTPIIRDNEIYVTTGYGVGCMLVKIAHDQTASVVYDNKTMKNHHGGVVLLGDDLYGHSDGVGWVCQEFATGERIWRERSELGKGAIAYAEGRFYCLSEDEGEVVLIDASTEGWNEQGRFTLEPQTEQRKAKGKIWTHPVIANGKLYLRDQELLFSFDINDN